METKKSFEDFLSDKCPTHTNNSPEGFERWQEQLDVQEVMDYAEEYGRYAEDFGFQRARAIALDVLNN